MIRALAVITVLGLALAPRAAHADVPNPPDGHYEKGRRLYDLEEYDAAIAEFKQGYLIDPSPVYLFNIAQAYRLKGDCASSEDFFKRYLKADPASTKREKIEKLVAECEPEPQDAPPDGDGTGGTALDPSAGSPIQQPPPPPPPDPGRSRRIAGLVTGVAGLALMGGGTALAIHVSGVQSELEDDCAAGCDWAEYRDRDASARTKSTWSKVLLVGGGVATIAGAALWFWGRSMTAETPVAVVPTDGGALVTTVFAF
jgi:tetratricopeptide (TPR) repeat protein